MPLDSQQPLYLKSLQYWTSISMHSIPTDPKDNISTAIHSVFTEETQLHQNVLGFFYVSLLSFHRGHALYSPGSKVCVSLWLIYNKLCIFPLCESKNHFYALRIYPHHNIVNTTQWETPHRPNALDHELSVLHTSVICSTMKRACAPSPSAP